MPKIDPVSGPVPREEFRRLVELPYGKAREAIRKYDPCYGLEPGKKITWEVKVKARRCYGTAYVEAATEEEAESAAQDIEGYEVDWDTDREDFEILSIEPSKQHM